MRMNMHACNFSNQMNRTLAFLTVLVGHDKPAIPGRQCMHCYPEHVHYDLCTLYTYILAHNNRGKLQNLYTWESLARKCTSEIRFK